MSRSLFSDFVLLCALCVLCDLCVELFVVAKSLILGGNFFHVVDHDYLDRQFFR